jgi:MFS family permease
LVYVYLLEPDKTLQQKCRDSADDEEEEENLPTTLDRPLLWNIIGGAIADNFGSTGLVPMCLSPLMYNAFFLLDVELEPIMSENAFRLIYAFVAISVVPGAAVSPYLFRKIGPAASCVGANVFTGLVIIALLYIGLATANAATFAIFVAVLYAAFPLTIISQLSTGPMLDRIAPVEMRGEVQGLNMTSSSLGASIAPFMLAIIADYLGIRACLWIATGLSFLAALINSPLMFEPLLQPRRASGPSRIRKRESRRSSSNILFTRT